MTSQEEHLLDEQSERINDSLIVALTGAIGSGKSQLARRLESRGASIIDADLLARDVVAPGTSGLKQVIAYFGSDMLTTEGTLDRKRLGALVFSDSAKRQELERILHPLIHCRFLEVLNQRRNAGEKVIVYVVPLIFESRLSYDDIDLTVAIDCPEENCIARIMERDSLTREQASMRYGSQLSNEQKAARADIVVPNRGTLADLDRVADELMGRLLTEHTNRAKS